MSLIVTLVLSATVFEILTLKARKSRNFPPLPSLRHPLGEGDTLEFCDEIWHQRTRIVGLPDGEEILTLAFFVLIQYRLVTDRRTDRQTDGHVAVAKTRARVKIVFTDAVRVNVVCVEARSVTVQASG